jgi:hypothetical protein
MKSSVLALLLVTHQAHAYSVTNAADDHNAHAIELDEAGDMAGAIESFRAQVNRVQSRLTPTRSLMPPTIHSITCAGEVPPGEL